MEIINQQQKFTQILTFLSLNENSAMSGPLKMFNNKITHLANLIANGDAINKSWTESNFLKLSGGTMSGALAMGNNKITGLAPATANGNAVDFEIFNKYVPSGFKNHNLNFNFNGRVLYNISQVVSLVEAITLQTANSKYLWTTGRKAMTGDLSMGNNKITNLADPQSDKDDVNLKTLNTHVIKPSDHTNRFAYLMDPKNGLLQWTDLLSDSIALNSIGDLETTSGNYHTYNKKVIYTSIKKNSEGGYKWKLAIQCFPLQKDKEYTLCSEILTTDYQLWHKSVITVDTTTSQGVTAKRWNVHKFTHEYKTSPNHTEFMYYHKVVVVFSKTASSTPYFLHVENALRKWDLIWEFTQLISINIT